MMGYHDMTPDMDNFMCVNVVYDGSHGGLIAKAIYEVSGALENEVYSSALSLTTDQKVSLRIEKRKDSYSLSYSLDHHNFTELMSIPTSAFKVSYVGLEAFNATSGADFIAVDFDNLKLQFFPPIPSMPAIIYLLN